MYPLKLNRKVTLCKADKLQGHWHKLETLVFKKNQPRLIYPEGLETPVLLIKQIFTNKVGQEAVQYLVTSQTKLSNSKIIHTYQKRLGRKNITNPLNKMSGAERSRTQTLNTRTNHFFAAPCHYIKLKRVKIKTQQNHFALNAKLYLKTLLSALQTLKQLNQGHLSASGETTISRKSISFSNRFTQIDCKTTFRKLLKGQRPIKKHETIEIKSG